MAGLIGRSGARGRRAAGPPARGRPSRRPSSAARNAAGEAAGLVGSTTRSTASANAKAMAVGLLALLGTSMSAIIFVMYQLLAGDAAPPRPTAVATPRPFTVPSNAVLFGSLADFEKGLLKPGIPFSLTITEAELNARITAATSKQPDAPYRDVVAHLKTDVADFDGRVRAAGVELSPTVTMRFWADRGTLLYDITSISFGPLPVPSMARDAIGDTVRRQLDSQKMLDKYLIDDVQVRPGAVTLVGRLK